MGVTGFNSGLSDALQSIMEQRLKARQQEFNNALALKEEERKTNAERRAAEEHAANLADRVAVHKLAEAEKLQKNYGAGAQIPLDVAKQVDASGLPVSGGITLPSTSSVGFSALPTSIPNLGPETPDLSTLSTSAPPSVGKMITTAVPAVNQLEQPTPIYNPVTGSGAHVPTLNTGSAEQQQKVAQQTQLESAAQLVENSGHPSAPLLAGVLRTSGGNPAVMDTVAKAMDAWAAPPEQHSPAYKEYQDYVKLLPIGTKPMSFDAYMTMDANRKKPTVNIGGISLLYDQTDPKIIAAGIRSGNNPPLLTNYGRVVQGAVATELGKRGPNGEQPFNLSNATRIWNATTKLNASLNGFNQVRFDEAIRSSLAMYDQVDQLADEWKSLGLSVLSRANLKAAMEGLKGPAAQSLANRLTGQIGQLTSDIATIEQNGLVPTDSARAVAAKSMQEWWGTGTIHDMTNQGRVNSKIRQTARNTTQVLTVGNTPPDTSTLPATPGGSAVPSPSTKYPPPIIH